MMTINQKSNKNTPLFLIIITLVLCTWGQFDHGEWSPDEPRVVAISLEMSKTDQWIIPHLAGQPFIEKPPLYFAMAAAAIKTLSFLQPVFAVRVVNILLALLTLYFTYLLTRNMTDKRSALLSVILLGTMEGFVTNFHWSRVDNLLILSLIASSWAFYVGFFSSQRRYILLAGFFTGIGFLSKGIIALIMIGAIWLALTVTLWLITKKFISHSEQLNNNITPSKNNIGFKLLPFIKWNLAAFIVFCVVAGSWVVLLRITGTEAIWHEWFWVNHVGRFMGTTPKLGHLHPHQPLYYVKAIAEYSLPWLPLFVLWFGKVTVNIFKKENLTTNNIFLFLALVLNISLLTISETKRGLYLFPLLPLIAIATVSVLSELEKKWFVIYSYVWRTFCVVVIMALLTLPFYSELLANKLPTILLTYFSHFNWYYALVVALIIGSFWWQKQKKFTQFESIALVTLLFYISFFTLLNPSIDIIKSKREQTSHLLSKIPLNKRAHIASFGFSETNQAMFFIMDNWSIPKLDNIEQVADILKGKSQYDSVIVLHKGALKTLFKNYSGRKPLYKILAVQQPDLIKSNEHFVWLSKY